MALEHVLFGSAQALQNHQAFDQACCIVPDVNLLTVPGYRGQASAQGRRRFRASSSSSPERMALRRAWRGFSGCIAYLTEAVFRAIIN